MAELVGRADLAQHAEVVGVGQEVRQVPGEAAAEGVVEVGVAVGEP